ncbi:MAG: outer membrane beta-barrel protein [Xanthobacteraceae bacterium]|jgi:outer membrane immunogenic protein
MSNPFAEARPRANPLVLACYLFAAAAPLACGATAAVAADMPIPTKAAAAPAAPPYQWTGCYVGLNAGGGASGTNVTTAVGAGGYLAGLDPGEVSNDGTGSANAANVLGGGQAGCNWQTGTIVVGLEGDLDYYRSNSNFFNDTNTLPTSGNSFVIGQSLTTNYLATVRPRIGVAADRNFGYLTGGAAFTDAHYMESYVDSGGGSGVATVSKFLTGWTAGAGWEYAWTDHVTLKFEYLYASFSTTSATGVIVGPGGSNPLHGSSDLVIQVARAGMNFKF